MIKLRLFILSLLLFNNAYAQKPVQNEYTEVVTVDSVQKTILYDRAIQWFSEVFKSSNAVIQSQDKESGVIIGNGIFELSEYDAIRFTVSVAVKEGRYKYVINKLWHEGHGGGYGNISRVEKIGGDITDEEPDCSMPRKHWKKLQEQCSEKIGALIKSLHVSMKSKSISEGF